MITANQSSLTLSILNDYRSSGPAEGLRREAQAQINLLYTPNQTEAVSAKMEKRAPKFTNPE